MLVFKPNGLFRCFSRLLTWWQVGAVWAMQVITCVLWLGIWILLCRDVGNLRSRCLGLLSCFRLVLIGKQFLFGFGFVRLLLYLFGRFFRVGVYQYSRLGVYQFCLFWWGCMWNTVFFYQDHGYALYSLDLLFCLFKKIIIPIYTCWTWNFNRGIFHRQRGIVFTKRGDHFSLAQRPWSSSFYLLMVSFGCDFSWAQH